jgi:hypothetical protein
MSISRSDPEIVLTNDRDIITLEEDEDDPRVKMPCGHAITAGTKDKDEDECEDETN